MRVARSRRLVAEGYALATVARVMQVSRQALYRRPKPRSVPQRRSPVMRERKLIQRRRPLERRKRPGFFRVERPRQL